MRDLLADKAKGSMPKDALGSQPPLSLPSPPPPTVNLFAITNLKKKRKDKGLAKGGGGSCSLKRSPSSRRRPRAREGPLWSRVRRPSTRLMCAIQLGTPCWSWMAREYPGTLPSRSSREVPPNVLERPLLLPKDMDALKNVRQQDLFMSLKKDLALVSFSTCPTDFIPVFFFFFFFFYRVFLHCLYAGNLGGFHYRGMGERRPKRGKARK